MATVFKIRDKLSGTYWNGDVRWSKFVEDKGKVYKTRAAAEKAVEWVIRYKENFHNAKVEIKTDGWEIVEYEVVHSETNTHSIEDYMKHCKLKAEIGKIDAACGRFMDIMYRKGHADKVQFLFKLKSTHRHYVDFHTIKEGRACLRQLGVKTNTFKESRGVFGMLDREQALRARLTLDVATVIDVAELRTKLGI